MAKIIPAILPSNFEDLREHLRLVREHVSRVQIDIVDGYFAPSKTWPFNRSDAQFEKLLDQEEGLPFWQDLDFEIDMMVEKPERFIDDWIRAGATALIIHHRSTEIFDDILKEAREREVEIGLAVRPSMEDSEWHPLVPQVDFVQLMGNDRIGEQGVALDDERVYPQIARVKEAYPDVTLGIDIGVSRETAPRLVEAGVSRLASGSGVFQATDIKEAITYFKSL